MIDQDSAGLFAALLLIKPEVDGAKLVQRQPGEFLLQGRDVHLIASQRVVADESDPVSAGARDAGARLY